MKRDKKFYYTLLIIFFVLTYVISFILSARTIEIGAVIATASVVIYPLTYFIATLFCERYGKDKIYNLLNYSAFGLIFASLLITFASIFPVYGEKDGLNAIFNIDFRILFGSLIGFYGSQYLNIKIYEFLDNKKWFKFLVSATISITVDSLIFILLGYLGSLPFRDVVIMFAGQYVMSVGLIIIYSIIFYNLIDSINKNIEDEDAIINEKIFDEEYEINLLKSNEKLATEKEVAKKAPAKKTTSTKKTTTTKKTTSTKKATTTKKTPDKKTTSTTKKTTTKKETK